MFRSASTGPINLFRNNRMSQISSFSYIRMREEVNLRLNRATRCRVRRMLKFSSQNDKRARFFPFPHGKGSGVRFAEARAARSRHPLLTASALRSSILIELKDGRPLNSFHFLGPRSRNRSELNIEVAQTSPL